MRENKTLPSIFTSASSVSRVDHVYTRVVTSEVNSSRICGKSRSNLESLVNLVEKISQSAFKAF